MVIEADDILAAAGADSMTRQIGGGFVTLRIVGIALASLSIFLCAIPAFAKNVTHDDIVRTYSDALAEYGIPDGSVFLISPAPVDSHHIQVSVMFNESSGFGGDDDLGNFFQDRATAVYSGIVFNTTLQYTIRTTPDHALVELANGATNIGVDDNGPFIDVMDTYGPEFDFRNPVQGGNSVDVSQFWK